MPVQYNQWIVALSYVVAVFASYIALDMASRVSASKGSSTGTYWLVGGSAVMGTGIWSMHFVGMLAFSLPIPVPYSVPITFLSLVFAIGAAGIALRTISDGTLTGQRLLVAGVVMGCGIGVMHYTGMAALQVFPAPTYDPTLFTLSIVIAIAASIAAMWICFQLKADTIATAFWKKSASALVMGMAIWGMHFTGMAAAEFDKNSYCLGNPLAIDNQWLASTVGLCTFLLLSATMLISLVDAKMAERSASLEAQSERFFNQSLNLICICGVDGRFRRINPACWQTLGYTPDAMMAMLFTDLVHPDDRPAVDAALRRLADTVAASSIECRWRCADGSYKSLLWNATRSGTDRSFYATGHDITERKRAEAELEQTHAQLLEASRRGGMAEVATNVLHNVGNVLNSVNVSAGLIVDSLAHSRAVDVAKVAKMLRENEGNLGDYLTRDPKGRHIPAFLDQVSHEWQGQQQTVSQELRSLRTNIDHIKEIVATQQSHARAAGTTEVVHVRDLVEYSLRMTEDGSGEPGPRVVRAFEDVPAIDVEKHKVLQILVNLVRNAKRACAEPGTRAQPEITLRIAQVGDRIEVSVSDNGAGIAPENLTRIFAHGFTTRTDGHGFGLNSGALAAAELGGRLSAYSAGVGRGATFTLELPLRAEAGARA